MYFVPVLNLVYIKYENARRGSHTRARARVRGHARIRMYIRTYVRSVLSVYRRIKYNQTRQTCVMNQIISDRARVGVGKIIYTPAHTLARSLVRPLAKRIKAGARVKKQNEL